MEPAARPNSVDEATRLGLTALREIYTTLADVDMVSMPHVPEEAPCRNGQRDPEDWFNPFRGRTAVKIDQRFHNQEAQRLCDGCPVLSACLSWGIANPAQGGILGGTTQEQRKEQGHRSRYRIPAQHIA